MSVVEGGRGGRDRRTHFLKRRDNGKHNISHLFCNALTTLHSLTFSSGACFFSLASLTSLFHAGSFGGSLGRPGGCLLVS